MTGGDGQRLLWVSKQVNGINLSSGGLNSPATLLARRKAIAIDVGGESGVDTVVRRGLFVMLCSAQTPSPR